MNRVSNRVVGWFKGVRAKIVQPLQNEKGATIVEILGYALLAVLAIVVLWGLISGWIPKFFDSITGKLDNLS
ncbi:hypothetical protein J1TS5_04050 [Paenibacillus macerans]|uniref:hypothetical protein n=1 Tax=Paenibacillus macerans TaxID=44252 RepID=UPI001B0AFA62|nr:hypothetical protein [Paenibacillus macerans]GIP08235.1 hypothetical protein J1TS5_04050 [Paenibacillus macerans]